MRKKRKKKQYTQYLIPLAGMIIALGIMRTNHARVEKIKGIMTSLSPSEIISFTNLTRIHYDVPTLTPNEKLMMAAQNKAQDMIDNQYFDHTDKSGSGPWRFLQESEYIYHFAGENLARNFQFSEEVVDGWIKSPEHLDNLISAQYTEVGVAVKESEEGVVIVQILASPIDQSIVGTIQDSLDDRYIALPSITGESRRSSPYTTLSYTSFILIFAIGSGVYVFQKMHAHSVVTPHIKHWKK